MILALYLLMLGQADQSLTPRPMLYGVVGSSSTKIDFSASASSEICRITSSRKIEVSVGYTMEDCVFAAAGQRVYTPAERAFFRELASVMP